jgi:hypothetical protein
MNSSAAARRPQQGGPPLRTAPVLRREQLRDLLSGAVDALHRCRVDLVPEGFIADCVALDRLKWIDGSLRITSTGSNICMQIRTGLA